MSCFSSTMFEENENFTNWCKVKSAGAVDTKKRFFARKIRKLTKILKFGTKSLAQKFSSEERDNVKNYCREEIRQNNENERLERKLLSPNQHHKWDGYEIDNALNENSENWDNWDACYLCAGNGQYRNYQQHTVDDHRQSELHKSSLESDVKQRSLYNSICYVFMPGQIEPIPVKLRKARIPGGVMWISYRPDIDIRSSENLYANSVSQIAQAQRPIMV